MRFCHHLWSHGTTGSRLRRVILSRRTGRGREDALDLLLARREERVLSKALTFSYGGTKYCVNTGGPATALRGAKVMVHHFANDRLRVIYKNRVLALTAYGTYPVADAPADEKTLDARIDALVAAHKPAGPIVSGRSALQMPEMTYLVPTPRGHSYVAQRGDILTLR